MDTVVKRRGRGTGWSVRFLLSGMLVLPTALWSSSGCTGAAEARRAGVVDLDGEMDLLHLCLIRESELSGVELEVRDDVRRTWSGTIRAANGEVRQVRGMVMFREASGPGVHVSSRTLRLAEGSGSGGEAMWVRESGDTALERRVTEGGAACWRKRREAGLE